AGEIAYLNESVWISARLSASTGDPRWVVRYRGTLDRRNAALAEFQALDPELYEEQAVSQLRKANQRLHEIETEAFALSAHGQSAAAASLLIGSEYDHQKQIGSDATAEIARVLSAGADSALDSQRRRGRTVVITVAVAVL